MGKHVWGITNLVRKNIGSGLYKQKYQISLKTDTTLMQSAYLQLAAILLSWYFLNCYLSGIPALFDKKFEIQNLSEGANGVWGQSLQCPAIFRIFQWK